MAMNREYHRNYSKEYYHRRRAEYVALLGGKCVSCNAVDGLQFDHIDPFAKSFPIAKLLNVSKAVALLELQKCQLLCRKCHAVKTRVDGSSAKIDRVKSKKLTWGDVAEIRRMASGRQLTHREIGRMYGVTKGAVWLIANNKTWVVRKDGGEADRSALEMQ